MPQRVLLSAVLSLATIVAVVFFQILSDPPSRQGVAAENQPSNTARTIGQQKSSAEFNQAGVCARCHVVSVLEWSISGHVAAKTNCQKCHGPSRGHVANERNEVKPDRLPRGAAIARAVCSTCHETGCPVSLQNQNCQQCHHVHALIDPKQSPDKKNNRLDKLMARWRTFEQHLATGEKHISQQDWKLAELEFQAALALVPGNHRAQKRQDMCRRRLNPQLPGFEVVGQQVELETGLPHQVKLVELGTPMVLVPPGVFDMGADAWPSSRPAHTVKVDAFYLGQHEVTQALWKTIMDENPSAHQGTGFPDAQHLPVERVSWDDCQQFLMRLNQRVVGGGFRLPSEAEWEYTCRAGEREFPLPTDQQDAAALLSARAWFRQNSLRKPESPADFKDIGEFAPQQVAALQPNRWNLYDMQGNVAEWCSSLFRPYLYDATDGRELLSHKGMRVLRGGGFADTAVSLHPAARHAERPHRRLRWNGLRLARDVPSLQVNKENPTQANP